MEHSELLRDVMKDRIRGKKVFKWYTIKWIIGNEKNYEGFKLESIYLGEWNQSYDLILIITTNKNYTIVLKNYMTSS